MERVPVRGPSPRLAATALGAVIVLFAGVAVSDRLAGRPREATPSPVPSFAVAPQRARLPLSTRTTLLSPTSGATLPGSLPIHVWGTSGAGASDLRAVVTASGREIGRIVMRRDDAGTFHGRIPIYPPPYGQPGSRLELSVVELPRGSAVANVPLALDPMPVSLWTPSRSPAGVFGTKIRVSGATVGSLRRVTVRLALGSGRPIREMSVPTDRAHGPWRTFRTELTLPERRPPEGVILEVSWPDADASTAAGRIRVPLIISRGRTQLLASHKVAK